MKITRLITFKLPPRWLFVRIDTDAGDLRDMRVLA